MPSIHGLLGSPAHHRGTSGVADPLGKVDPAHAVALDGHVPDLRLQHPFVTAGSVADALHFLLRPWVLGRQPVFHRMFWTAGSRYSISSSVNFHVHRQRADLPAQGLGLRKAPVLQLQGLVPVVGLAELGQHLDAVGLQILREVVSLLRADRVVLVDVVESRAGRSGAAADRADRRAPGGIVRRSPCAARSTPAGGAASRPEKPPADCPAGR